MKPRAVHLTLLALLLSGGVGTAVTTWAQRGPGPDPFSAFDLNGDGSVSAEEFAQHRAERMKARADEGRPMQHAGQGPSFESMDANGDGKLTPDEMRPMGNPGMRDGAPRSGMMGGGRGPGMADGQRAPRFEEVDTNGDGHIDPDELAAMRSARLTERAEAGYPMRNAGNMPSFEQLDLNGDGGISGEEFGAHIGQHPPGGGPGMKTPARAPETANDRRPPRFEEMDLNGDGRIDPDELATMRRKHLTERAEAGYPMRNAGNMESFEQMDLNGDGGISAEEFGAHIDRHRSSGRPLAR